MRIYSRCFLRRCCNRSGLRVEIRTIFTEQAEVKLSFAVMKYGHSAASTMARRKQMEVTTFSRLGGTTKRSSCAKSTSERFDQSGLTEPEAIAILERPTRPVRPGGQRVYSDMAIETGLVVRMVYKLAYRVLPPSSVATPCLNANVSWPACVGERH